MQWMQTLLAKLSLTNTSLVPVNNILLQHSKMVKNRISSIHRGQIFSVTNWLPVIPQPLIDWNLIQATLASLLRGCSLIPRVRWFSTTIWHDPSGPFLAHVVGWILRISTSDLNWASGRFSVKCPWQTTLSWLVSLVKSQLHLSGQKETIEGDSPGLRPETGDLEMRIDSWDPTVCGKSHCVTWSKVNVCSLTWLCNRLAWQQWRRTELGPAQIGPDPRWREARHRWHHFCGWTWLR